jgi:hypothetical protein
MKYFGMMTNTDDKPQHLHSRYGDTLHASSFPQTRQMMMWWETELFIQQNVLLSDLYILCIN